MYLSEVLHRPFEPAPITGKLSRAKINWAVMSFELSRLRGGRFACNTPDVMHDAYAMALIYLSKSYQNFSN